MSTYIATMTDLLDVVADVLNREYQSGGDAETLGSVASVIVASLDEKDGERFADFASMGGLTVTRADLCRRCDLPLHEHWVGSCPDLD